MAINSARSTLKLVVEDDDIRSALIGVPIFTHTMIAMCATFLVKLAVAFAATDPHSIFRTRLIVPKNLAPIGLTFDTRDVLSLVMDLTQVLEDVTKHVGNMHLASQINAGIRALLSRFEPIGVDGEYRYTIPFAGDATQIPAKPSGSALQGRTSSTFISETPMSDTHVHQADPVHQRLAQQQEQDLGPMMGAFDFQLDQDFLWPSMNDGDGDQWFPNTFSYAQG